MTAQQCTQPGCDGTIEDGYCDVCGMAPAPAASGASGPSGPSGPSGSVGYGSRPYGSGIVSVAM